MSLAGRFSAFAGTTAARAPLYARLAAALAGSPLLPELYARAPGRGRVPVALFAAVHYLLLGEPDAPLARFYPNLAGRVDDADPVPDFLRFCADRLPELRELLATRLPQTNEVGRSALLVAGLGTLGRVPLAHLDVGASAGLNLMLDRLAYADGHGTVLGRSRLVLECATEGTRPAASGDSGLADHLPHLAARLGLDEHPVDLSDPDSARWLQACVWPDQADRFQRLRTAIDLFGEDPVEVVAGDAVADLAATLDRLPEGALPVVTTTWALSYLDRVRQEAFVAELGRLGRGTDLGWVWVEAPDQVGVLPVPDHLDGVAWTVLGLTTWRDGVRTDRTLARCHPHGYWLAWF